MASSQRCVSRTEMSGSLHKFAAVCLWSSAGHLLTGSMIPLQLKDKGQILPRHLLVVVKVKHKLT